MRRNAIQNNSGVQALGASRCDWSIQRCCIKSDPTEPEEGFLLLVSTENADFLIATNSVDSGERTIVDGPYHCSGAICSCGVD